MLEWTREFPRCSGAFWVREGPRDKHPLLVDAYANGALAGGYKLWVCGSGNEYVLDMFDGYEWAGPIPEPKERDDA